LTSLKVYTQVNFNFSIKRIVFYTIVRILQKLNFNCFVKTIMGFFSGMVSITISWE